MEENVNLREKEAWTRIYELIQSPDVDSQNIGWSILAQADLDVYKNHIFSMVKIAGKKPEESQVGKEFQDKILSAVPAWEDIITDEVNNEKSTPESIQLLGDIYSQQVHEIIFADTKTIRDNFKFQLVYNGGK